MLAKASLHISTMSSQPRFSSSWKPSTRHFLNYTGILFRSISTNLVEDLPLLIRFGLLIWKWQLAWLKSQEETFALKNPSIYSLHRILHPPLKLCKSSHLPKFAWQSNLYLRCIQYSPHLVPTPARPNYQWLHIQRVATFIGHLSILIPAFFPLSTYDGDAHQWPRCLDNYFQYFILQ